MDQQEDLKKKAHKILFKHQKGGASYFSSVGGGVSHPSNKKLAPKDGKGLFSWISNILG